MKNNIKTQGLWFVAVSGIGWLMDFGIYTAFTSLMQTPVAIANILSSIPAITFVFIFSTRRIFEKGKGRFSLKQKYAVYLCYQGMLVFFVSCLAEFIYGCLQGADFLANLAAFHAIIAKCLITPITMFCNFIFMKILSEKV